MKTSRQVERRDRFQSALARMPDFETWTTTDHDVPPRVVATNMYEAGMNAVTKTVEVEPPRIRHHFKIVPRRVRRSMARALAKREFKTARGL